MTTDAETLKKTLMLFTKALRQMEHEMLAHVAVTSMLKQQLGLDDGILDQMLEAARGSDAVEQQLRQKYDERAERILAAIDEVDLQKQLLSLLETVGSKGPVN
jgi:hypothetical protein